MATAHEPPGSRRDRLDGVFETAPVAVALVRGADRVVEYANPAFTELFPLAEAPGHGAATVADLGLARAGAHVEEVIAHGRPVRDDDQRTRGDDQVASISYSPIPLGPGLPPDVLVVGVDVSAQARDRYRIQRHAEEQQLLARATAAMQTAVEPAAELDALARSLVPQFADACSAVLLDRPVAADRVGEVELTGRRVAFAAADDLAVADDLGEPPPLAGDLSWGRSGLLAEAIRTGRPAVDQLDVQTPSETLASAQSAGSLAWLARVGPVSVAAAPIRLDGAVAGVLVFVARAARKRFTRADLAVMERVSVRAEAALGQGLAYQRQRETSLALQRSMLSDAPIVPGLQVVARYRPTALDSEVGGDWYDTFALPDGDLAVVIGDVAGHDLAAAATMGQLRSMLRALVYDRDEAPGELLERLDRTVTGLHVTDFTTLVLGRLRLAGPAGGPARLRWSNAGHPPPLLIEPDGRARLLDGGAGMVLGVAPSRHRTSTEVELPAGATLLLYTDGLVERRGHVPDADVAALVGQALADGATTVDHLCDRLVDAAPVADDVAVVAVRIDGDPPAVLSGSGG